MEKEINVLLTWHLLDAAEEYDFPQEKLLEFLLFPDEVVIGHGNRFVAHKKLKEHLARIVYEYENNTPVVISFYIAKVDRYYKGGIHEDKVLS